MIKYNNTTRAQLLFFAVILLLSTFGFIPKAHAATGTCFFTSTAGPVTGVGACSAPGRYGAYGSNDVFSGRSASGAGSAIPACVNTKAEFIAYILSRYNNTSVNCANSNGPNNTQDQVGAAFIIQEMRSNSDTTWPSGADITNWVTLMNLPTVSVSKIWDSTVGRTSYYDTGKHNDFYAAHPTVGRDVILVKQGAKVIAEIEVLCGNMVAGPGVITPPTWAIGSSTVATPAFIAPGQTATFTHTVNNIGPDDMDKGITINARWTRAAFGGVVANTIVKSCNDADGFDAGTGTTLCSNTFVIPPLTPAGTLYCQSVYYSPQKWNVGATANSTEDCVTVIQAATYVPYTTSSGNYEKGQTAGSTFEHGISGITVPCSGAFANGSLYAAVAWTAQPTAASGIGSTISGTFQFANCDSTRVSVVVGAAAAVYVPIVGGKAAFYTYTLSAADNDTLSAASIPSTFSRRTSITGFPDGVAGINIYSVPYTRFYGNDIYASGCGTDANNGTIGFNTKVDDVTNLAAAATGSAAGSAVEYAAFALKDSAGVSKLNHISSGVYNSYPVWTGSPPNFLRLSSNFVAGKMVCPATVLSSVTNELPDNSNITTTAVNTYNVYAANGGNRGFLDANTTNLKITATGGNGATAAKQTIYANDVYINNDISLGVPSPFDPTTAPVLLIVAKGDVYIDKSVGTIQAIIVAGGTIYTCADNSVPAAYTAGNLNGNCDNPLTVNGSLVAQNIKFGRTYGTRLCAAAYDVTANSSCTPKALGTPAEVISYPAYMHFTSPYLKDTAGSTFPAIFNPAPYF